MSKCVIRFVIEQPGDNDMKYANYDVSIDSNTKITPDVIAQAIGKLRQNVGGTNLWDDLCNRLQNKMYKYGMYSRITTKQLADLKSAMSMAPIRIRGTKGREAPEGIGFTVDFQPNVDFTFLSNEFGITFPTDADQYAKVLLVDNLTVNGKKLFDSRIINSDGTELFLIGMAGKGDQDSNKNKLKALSNYITFRQRLGEINFEPDSLPYKIMETYLKTRKDGKKVEGEVTIQDIRALIAEVYNNRDKFATEKVTYENQTYIIRQEVGNIVNSILQYEDMASYDNYIVNGINQMKRYNIQGRGRNNSTIDMNGFLNLMQEGVILRNSTTGNEQLDQAIRQTIEQESKKGGSKKGTVSISKSNTLSEILKLDTKERMDKFRNIMKALGMEQVDDMKQEQLREVRQQVIGKLVQTVLSTEPEFRWEFQSVEIKKNSKKILLNNVFPTLQERYGITLQTIYQEDDQGTYRGYHMYKFPTRDGKVKYIGVIGSLTENDRRSAYDTMEEAKKKIDQTISKGTIRQDSMFAFKTALKQKQDMWDQSRSIKTAMNLQEGQVIDMLDMEVDMTQRMDATEQNLLEETLDNWTGFVDKNYRSLQEDTRTRLKEKLTSAEQVATFLYIMNGLRDNEGKVVQMNDRTDDQVNAVIDQITDMSRIERRKAYYISKKSRLSNGMYSYRIVPTNWSIIEDYRKGEPARTPIISMISAVNQALTQGVFGKKYNLQIHYKTAQEVIADLGEGMGNRVKAYVKDGQIFINMQTAEASDSIHEYTHIFLAMMRSNEELAPIYEQLMYRLMQDKRAQETMKKIRNTSTYSTLSQMDLAEEVFVRMFTEHVYKSINTGFDSNQDVFSQTQEQSEKALNTLFEKFGDDLKEHIFRNKNLNIEKMTLNQAFAYLSRGIRTWDDSFQTQTDLIRQIKLSKLVDKLIQDKEIKEVCV